MYVERNAKQLKKIKSFFMKKGVNNYKAALLEGSSLKMKQHFFMLNCILFGQMKVLRPLANQEHFRIDSSDIKAILSLMCTICTTRLYSTY